MNDKDQRQILDDFIDTIDDLMNIKLPIAIKVKLDYLNKMKNEQNKEVNGIPAIYSDLPVLLDNNIKEDYEIVYEE